MPDCFVEKNKIKKILEQTVPNSLGQFYESVTQYLGFNEFGDEYKVMGLSAYGKPKYYNQIKEIIDLDSRGLIKINPNKWKYNIYKRNSGKGIFYKYRKLIKDK